MSHSHRNTDSAEIWKEALIGAAAGLVGAGIGFLVDYKISQRLLTGWNSANSHLLESQVRGFGSLKSLFSGGVSGLTMQLTANIIDKARGADVNWANIGWAAGGGVLGGVASGWFGATRLRVGMSWLKATTAKGVRPRQYKVVDENEVFDIISAAGRVWPDYVEETTGQRFGVLFGQFAGAGTSVGAAAGNEYD